MPISKINGVNLYHEVHGDGPVVVFLHGSGGNHAIWWQQVRYFARRYKVVTLDLRGFGRSDNVEGGPDCLDFPADVIGLLDALKIERAAVIGQSIGGTSCLRLAVRYPRRISAVVLAASTGSMDHAELSSLTARDRKKADALPVLDRLMSKPFQEQHPDLTWLFQQIGTFNAASQATVRNLTAKGPTPEEVSASNVPALFLLGELDAVLSLETMQLAHRLVRQSTLTVVPNGPHSLYWENPPVFNCVVDQFLATTLIPAGKATATV
jgi:pimeloyl-ACP methyl ester carboxylesterase